MTLSLRLKKKFTLWRFREIHYYYISSASCKFLTYIYFLNHHRNHTPKLQSDPSKPIASNFFALSSHQSDYPLSLYINKKSLPLRRRKAFPVLLGRFWHVHEVGQPTNTSQVSQRRRQTNKPPALSDPDTAKFQPRRVNRFPILRCGGGSVQPFCLVPGMRFGILAGRWWWWWRQKGCKWVGGGRTVCQFGDDLLDNCLQF